VRGNLEEMLLLKCVTAWGWEGAGRMIVKVVLLLELNLLFVLLTLSWLDTSFPLPFPQEK
jgi:hypothetical protein